MSFPGIHAIKSLMTPPAITIRSANEEDRQPLANLIHFQMQVHRHLDWRAPLDWIGHRPYLIAERHGKPFSILVCPPDPPEIAWIRLFAVPSPAAAPEAWDVLWPVAVEQLAQQDSPAVAAIPLQGWFLSLLKEHHFEPMCEVVMLQWDPYTSLPAPALSSVNIRPMLPDDLPAVVRVDQAAFGNLWRNSYDALKIALGQASIATVAETEEGVIGYQISTPSAVGGHLARLAVLPQSQCHGLGYALVYDLLKQFKRRGARQVTVNTQSDNTSSLAVYTRAGFRATGETYPVFVHRKSAF